jgi:ATP-dependent helicase/DNAse subunit B
LAASLLITGPPASGKSRAALEHFLSEPGAVLLTPTATMAEHIRNELARALVPVRPSRVLTLAQFLDRMSGLAAPSKAHLHTLIEQELDRLKIERFSAVAEYRGFRSAIAGLMEEVDRGGLPQDLARLTEEVERALASKGLGLRNARLRAAARADSAVPPLIVPSVIIVDGFFTFSDAELDFIEGLARCARIVVTLPEWPGSAAARSCLIATGFIETTLTGVHRAPLQEVFSTATIEQEIEEIARRILDEVARGRAFREMGIVLRVREPYASALSTVLARFGIPARFYFADPVSSHPAIQFLSGVVRASLGGWDHADLLRVLRMPVSGLGATPDGDRFDFDTRASLPGRGLPLVGLPEPLASGLAGMVSWSRDRIDAAGWAARIKTLRGVIPHPEVRDTFSAEQLAGWFSTAHILDAFDAALDEAAATFPDTARIPLSEFWSRVETALELNELRRPDRRRDVVHVVDVFEARQWELPIVFVCGMVERHFPQYHREDPLLDDVARRRAGLQTSVELQRQERSLFQLATSRATERAILSYSRFDEKGDPALPSFFLAGMNVEPCESRIRPRATRVVQGTEPPLIAQGPLQDAEVLQHLAVTHRTLSPSSIERFLQCPFQFFADRSLRLRVRPPAPRDRLDMLVQGSIIHAAIAALEEMPLLGAAVFDAEFATEAAKRRIPGGYRTEAVRLEMLRNFTAFLADGRDALGWPARVEEKFEIALSPELTVRGRIDRLEVGPHREALVIDYKYSVAKTIRDRVKNQDKGDVVQAGLYLFAAVKQFELTPAGMLYCGLRKDVEWDGWHLPLPGLEKIGESCTVERLEELVQAAQQKALDVFASIASGDIAVRPADEKKCVWCDYRDICRVETQ